MPLAMHYVEHSKSERDNRVYADELASGYKILSCATAVGSMSRRCAHARVVMHISEDQLSPLRLTVQRVNSNTMAVACSQSCRPFQRFQLA